jgi:hypothetical protein
VAKMLFPEILQYQKLATSITVSGKGAMPLYCRKMLQNPLAGIFRGIKIFVWPSLLCIVFRSDLRLEIQQVKTKMYYDSFLFHFQIIVNVQYTELCTSLCLGAMEFIYE